MYEMADKYNISGLKKLSKEKFRGECGKYWDDEAFPIAADYAFSTTMEADKGLRDIVITTVAKHTKLIRKPQMQVIMKEFGSLALGVLLKRVGQSGSWVFAEEGK
jgi:hypothetical protein